MQARMKSPAALLPDTQKAVQMLYGATFQSGAPATILNLAHLRASQINGCASCVAHGAEELRKAGETPERLATVAVWREAPWFTDAERAALDLAESATRLADNPHAVPDDVWNEAARHFDEKALAGLILWIGVSNFFNRMNATVRHPAGTPWF